MPTSVPLWPSILAALLVTAPAGCQDADSDPANADADADDVASTASDDTTSDDAASDDATSDDTTSDDTASNTPPPPGVHTVRVDDIDIVYEITGQGEPAVVLVHGAQSTRETWADIVGPLAVDRRVITLDLPGHGDSGTPAALPPEVFTTAVTAVLDDARIDHAILVGHSFGVWIARDLALAQPDQILGLVMLDGFLVPLGGDRSIGQALLAQFQSDDWQAAAESFVDTFMFAANTPEAVRQFVRAMMLSAPQSLWIATLTIATDPAIESDARLDTPTLALFAPSLAMPPDYEAYLADRFTALDFGLEPEGTGHFIMLERPEALTTALRDFIDAVDP